MNSQMNRYAFLLDLYRMTVGAGWTKVNGKRLRKKYKLSSYCMQGAVKLNFIEYDEKRPGRPGVPYFCRWRGEQMPTMDDAKMLFKCEMDMVKAYNDRANKKKTDPDNNAQVIDEPKWAVRLCDLSFVPADDLIKELVRRKYTGNLYPPVEPIIL